MAICSPDLPGRFLAIYRNDPVPLALHVGQFLTVTVLGGACFGLPLQSWRTRAWVWRRYVLAPVPRSTFVISIWRRAMYC